MSVIIRLQNLPWSANALDIRQFFRGLSIPEGGVHIVGGEMGDAFIAFSTDEDARQAMMHDREAINGVQIRLLLSSRAEMQKVIETARQHSLLALKKASGIALTQTKASPSTVVVKKTTASSTPQPPVITASSFQNLLSNSAAAVTPSFLAYQQQAGFTLIPESNSNTTGSSTKNNDDSDDSVSRQSGERRRSDSREARRSKSRSRERGIFRRRREHSRDRSRERDWNNGKRSSRHRSRSRERSRARSRDRSRDRSYEGERPGNKNKDSDSRNNRSMDADVKSKSNIAPWSLTNSYQVNYTTAETSHNSFNKMSSSLGSSKKSEASLSSAVPGVAVTAAASNFQNYNISNQSLTALNNYSLSGIIGTGSGDSFKGFALQNPYTTAQKSSAKTQENESNTTSSSAIPGIFVEKKSNEASVNDATIDSVNSLPQEPIAFANVNPYEQMYPNLFAQAAALNSGQKPSAAKQAAILKPTNSPREEEAGPKEVDPNETNCIKISNMCSRTSYSDLRKFFFGLFIPHNGIKMLNDKHGLRVGIAYVQFSRQSSVNKALCRSNNLFKGRSVIIEPVSEQEFMEAEDSFRPPNQDKAYSHRSNDSDNEISESGSNGNINSSFSALNPYKKMIQLAPFNVLYIEDIPALATEQDIMKMFSSYSLYDILLIASPENRREFVAHVRFSREEDAKSAYEDRAHHQIGYRRVRIRPGSLEEMENAKEKIRLANEQLLKEEKAAEEEEEAKRKLEKLITDHITEEENKQKIISMDLTQEDDDEGNEDDIIETTNVSKSDGDDMNVTENNFNQVDVEENQNNFELGKNDSYSMQNQLLNKFNTNMDPRRSQTQNIPSLFDLDPMLSANIRNNGNRPNLFNDPRLRNLSERVAASSANAIDNSNNNLAMGGNKFNDFQSNSNNQKEINPAISTYSVENNFVILKNCVYNTRINDVAQLLLTANLALKHIEPLHNERQLPTGEFIVEFRRATDAEIAIERFHNIQFRNRSLRVFPITPQEIADRLGKPFLGYIPGGNGIRMTKSLNIDGINRNNLNLASNLMNNNNMRFGNNNQQNMNFNNIRSNNPFSDNGPINNSNNNGNGANNNNNGGSGIPKKFTYPGCVLSLENVPYKAQISDILRFFQGYDLAPDDIIRRFNDDGSPTGDARVAFMSAEEARSAFESRKRKQIFGRNIFIKII